MIAVTNRAQEAVCEVKSLTVSFRGLQALEDVSLTVHKGELTSLIGPNGAGKTTFFNCVSGFVKPTAGSIFLAGRDLKGMSTHNISRLGIKRTFQNVEVFRTLTVMDNVLMGHVHSMRLNILADMLRWPRTLRAEEEAKKVARETLALLGIDDFRDIPAGALPYGVQKKVELARALVSRPLLLMADEPVCGLNMAELDDMSSRLRRIRDELGISVLLIEHNMDFVMPLSDRVYVLNFGRLIAEGTPEEVKKNKVVLDAYLGGDGADA